MSRICSHGADLGAARPARGGGEFEVSSASMARCLVITVLLGVGCGGSKAPPAAPPAGAGSDAGSGAGSAAPSAAPSPPPSAETQATCETLYTKMLPYMTAELAKESKTITEADGKEFVAECAATPGALEDPIVVCVLATTDDAGVTACFDAANAAGSPPPTP